MVKKDNDLLMKAITPKGEKLLTGLNIPSRPRPMMKIF